MRKWNKYFFVFIVFALFLNLLTLNSVKAFILKPPTVIKVDQAGPLHLTKPLITGLTQTETEVMIYINGKYAGLAEINQEDTGTDNFYFQPAKPLSFGQHTVTAIAKDKTSLVLSSASKEIKFYIEPLPAPILLEPNQETVTGKLKPLITGLTVSNSLVHIYIDGAHNGKTENLTHESGTANFAYKPFLNLSIGEHAVWVVAEDEDGRKSQVSNILEFRIEEPMPAPILFTPVANSQTANNQPFVVGLAKNDSLIKVYIDHQLNGQFKVKNHESGTADFAYKPFLPLTAGAHLLYTEAIDERGKISVWSNIIYFNIFRSVQPTITAKAVEETGEIEEVEILSETLQPAEEQLAEEKGAATSGVEAIKEFLQQEKGEIAEETGLINESKEQQSKLQLNLIIFILFLIAVIAWIFWVNRELIKERRAQDKDKDDKSEKKLNL